LPVDKPSGLITATVGRKQLMSKLQKDRQTIRQRDKKTDRKKDKQATKQKKRQSDRKWT
jgi:hypothetical protein